MKQRVAIVGVGATSPGFLPNASWRELLTEASYQAFSDAKIEPSDIQAGFLSITCPELIDQESVGSMASDYLGLLPVGFPQIVNACAGGLSALRIGYFAVASGTYDCALVVGVEKISDGFNSREEFAMHEDAEYDYAFGLNFLEMMALIYRRHMRKYGTKEEQFAHFPVINREYAMRNPMAYYSRGPKISVGDVLNSPYVSTPLKAMECSVLSDGSSAAVLMSEDLARKHSDCPVYIEGISLKAGPTYSPQIWGWAPGLDYSECYSTKYASEEAYKMAGITPKEIDFCQIHDCFVSNAAIQMGALGVVERGKAPPFFADGQTALGGKCPTCTDGGRLAFGHPTGATGVYEIYESVTQLRGEAKNRQVDGAEVGVCQVTGGFNASSAVSVLKRRN